jgi:hypothetical protein
VQSLRNHISSIVCNLFAQPLRLYIIWRLLMDSGRDRVGDGLGIDRWCVEDQEVDRVLGLYKCKYIEKINTLLWKDSENPLILLW